jgi:hypothetical protein
MNVSIESSVITDVFNRKLFKEYGNYTGGGEMPCAIFALLVHSQKIFLPKALKMFILLALL